ncbi:MAG: hypothetical protein KatS3mg087_1415 [Patescibacteria group bacterium]|nr:MAG: hypothetical protein KatS3mg087_1415 [Patescibacteria group bacterium]
MIYFGFAVADSMFPAQCVCQRRPLTVEETKEILTNEEVKFCLNPSHRPTIEVARKMGLAIEIPESAPRVSLQPKDKVVVMSVRGLPRLEGRHEYTEEEINQASFTFGLWEVLS